MTEGGFETGKVFSGAGDRETGQGLIPIHRDETVMDGNRVRGCLRLVGNDGFGEVQACLPGVGDCCWALGGEVEDGI